MKLQYAVPPKPREIDELQKALATEFNIGVFLLLPLLLMLVLVYKRFPAYPSIVVSALVGAVFAVVFQPDSVIKLAGGSGDAMAGGSGDAMAGGSGDAIAGAAIASA